MQNLYESSECRSVLANSKEIWIEQKYSQEINIQTAVNPTSKSNRKQILLALGHNSVFIV